MTIRELWEDYRRRNVIEGMETPAEVAIQQAGFLCGVAATIGTLHAGDEIDLDGWETLLDEAMAAVHPECDKRDGKPESSPN